MINVTRLPLCLATGILLAGLIPVSAAKNEAAADPAKVDADYAFQGEYAGVLAGQFDVGAQVIALGDGKFKLVLYPGGLPGDGYDGAVCDCIIPRVVPVCRQGLCELIEPPGNGGG